MKTSLRTSSAATGLLLALVLGLATIPTPSTARRLTVFNIAADMDDPHASVADLLRHRSNTNSVLKGAPPSNPTLHFAKQNKPHHHQAAGKTQKQKQHGGGIKKKQQHAAKKKNLRAQHAPKESSHAPVEESFVPATAVSTNSEQSDERPGFDFIVAGFPKCGTTTLLKAFGAHPETDMAPSEQCSIASPLQADVRVHKLLDGTLGTLSSDPNVKRSFKCPTAMYNYKSISRMEKHSPNTKFVIGMRHPVKMLQSFYNYRVTEIKERGLDEPIPALHDVLAGDEPWKGVSMQSTRFELFLMQLGKTDISLEQLVDLMGQSYDLAVKPTKFSVFLYTVDQLEDSSEERSAALRQTMQDYLGLTQPIQPFGHENKNHAVGKQAHAESIVICDTQWAAVRHQLVEQGAATAAWLRDHLIHSPDVVVANTEHFLETLSSWGTDPCEEEAAVDGETPPADA